MKISPRKEIEQIILETTSAASCSGTRNSPMHQQKLNAVLQESSSAKNGLVDTKLSPQCALVIKAAKVYKYVKRRCKEDGARLL